MGREIMGRRDAGEGTGGGFCAKRCRMRARGRTCTRR